MRRAGVFGCLVVLWGLPGWARAGFITFTDEAAFRAAAGVLQEIDFETLPDGTPSMDDSLITPDFNYGDQGVIFSSPFPVLKVSGAPGIFGLSSQFVDTSARNWITADLLIPASAIGIFFPGDTTLSVYDINDMLIGSASFVGHGSGLFLGIISDELISNVVQDRGGSGERLEDFLFAPVPEPATLLLVAVGALGITTRRRNQTQR